MISASVTVHFPWCVLVMLHPVEFIDLRLTFYESRHICVLIDNSVGVQLVPSLDSPIVSEQLNILVLLVNEIAVPHLLRVVEELCDIGSPVPLVCVGVATCNAF